MSECLQGINSCIKNIWFKPNKGKAEKKIVKKEVNIQTVIELPFVRVVWSSGMLAGSL